MKKVIFAVLIMFTFALLMGGSCGGTEEIPTDLPTVTDTPTTQEDTTPEEPMVDPGSEIEKIKNSDFSVVYFDFDKYNIRIDARSALEYNAEMLKQYPDSRILIEGHCDERGTVEYNLALGERRAKAAMDYLVQLGISSARMEITSYGKERPVDLGHNEVAWQKNRRAGFNLQ